MSKKSLSLKNPSTIYHLPSTFVLWRLILFFAAYLGRRFIPLREGFLGGKSLGVWANFDGIHYLSIAKNGYANFEQTFFPLYPILIRFFAPVFKGNLLFSALFISHLSFFIALFLFLKLLSLDFKDKSVIIRNSLFIILCFPTSFFFACAYTESLFLMLVLGAFLSARRKKWWLAGILGCLASATRLAGVFLLPALLVEFWQQKKVRQRSLKRRIDFSLVINHWPLVIIPLGLFSYMFYLYKAFGDPFLFFHAQKAVGYRETEKIVLLPQVFWRYLKIFFTVSPHLFVFQIAVLEFLITCLFLFLLVKSFFYLPLSYTLFMLLSILVPPLTGTFNSMPRYVLTCFPGFILLGMIKDKKLFFVICSLFFVLLLLLTAFFTQGYFIA